MMMVCAVSKGYGVVALDDTCSGICENKSHFSTVTQKATSKCKDVDGDNGYVFLSRHVREALGGVPTYEIRNPHAHWCRKTNVRVSCCTYPFVKKKT